MGRTITGGTTEYGTLERIGGHIPHATLRLHTGSSVRLDLTVDQVKQYSNYLYKTVRVDGLAKWHHNFHSTDVRLKTIKVETIELFEQVSAEEAFKFLREKFGHHFDNFDFSQLQ